MLHEWFDLLMFSAKAIIVVVLILILFAGILALASKGKDKLKGRISIRNLNKKYAETQEVLLEEILSKDQYKKFQKKQKAEEKTDKKTASGKAKRIFLF